MQTQSIRIHLMTGDIFDVRRHGLQGVALFVPAGLTAFRVLASDFINAYGKPLSESGPLKVFRVESDAVMPLVRIVHVPNPGHRTLAKEDIGPWMEQAFSIFEAASCTTVGMNGFRLGEEDRSQNRFYSEQETLDAVRRWISLHPQSPIRNIFLIDKRGGFEHVT